MLCFRFLRNISTLTLSEVQTPRAAARRGPEDPTDAGEEVVRFGHCDGDTEGDDAYRGSGVGTREKSENLGRDRPACASDPQSFFLTHRECGAVRCGAGRKWKLSFNIRGARVASIASTGSYF